MVRHFTRQFVEEEWYWSICPEADKLSPLKNYIKTGPWLRSSIEAWDKLCLGEATTSFIFASYLFEKQASKEIGGQVVSPLLK